MRRGAPRRAGLVAALVIATGIVATGPSAAAHASLVATSPANGAEVDKAPQSIRMRFTEGVTPAPDGVVLRGSDGAIVATEPAAVAADDPTTIVLPVPADLPAGSYVVTFRVISADSHPFAGAFVFGVGQAPSSLGDVDLSGDPAVSVAYAAARWTSYAGLALLAGILAVFVLCWPGGWVNRRARRVLTVGWVASLTGAVASLLLQGPYGAGRSIVDMVDPELLSATLATDYGSYILARLGLILVTGALVLRPAQAAATSAQLSPAGPPVATTSAQLSSPASAKAPTAGQLSSAGRSSRVRDGAALAAGVALPVTWIGTGHANASGSPLDTAAEATHLVAMSTWFGGLVLLAICLLPRSASASLGAAEVGGALRRFSRLAMAAVGILVCTGTYLAWRRVGTFDALVGTAYGRLLAFKLAGLGLLVWLGAMSRTVVARRYQSPLPAVPADSGQSRSKRRAARAALAEERAARTELGRSVRVEVVLAVGVLAVASVLVATPPGVVVTAAEALRQDPALPVLEDVPLEEDGGIQVLVDPAWVGQNRVVVEVLDTAGDPWDVPEVRASFVFPGADIEALPVALARTGPGVYQAPETPLPFAGDWSLNITVRTTEIDSETVQVAVPVR